MQFYTVEQVTEMVLYTRQHLGHLERQDKFPRRVTKYDEDHAMSRVP